MSKPLKLDDKAESKTPGRPAFLSKPEGAPVYHGFPLIEETRMEGWCFGAITEYLDPNGCEEGDAFVEAPDGSRAGLVWTVGNSEVEEICPPDKDRWGVYSIAFPKAVRTTDDLVYCFRTVLPLLKQIHAKVSSKVTGRGGR
jgi:hypothetical protein